MTSSYSARNLSTVGPADRETEERRSRMLEKTHIQV